jgi:hypothetical protein
MWNSFNINGTAIGERKLNAYGRTYVFEPDSGLILEIIYNPFDKGSLGSFFSNSKAKADQVNGWLYKISQDAMKKFVAAHKVRASGRKKLQINTKTDTLEYVSKFDGVWHNHIKFDDKVYWDSEKDFPYILEYEANPLPSDAKFRHDLIYL